MAAWRRDKPHSFEAALQAAKEILAANPVLVAKGTIDTEAEQLVIAAYRAAGGGTLSRGEFFLRIHDRLPDPAGERLLVLAGSRAEGKPLQHLTGYQVFLDHEYEVGPDVLIPRPETEFLVVTALEALGKLDSPPSLGLEIGIGSGAISIEMLSVLPSLRMIATELTEEAERRARSNARRILGDEPAARRLEIARSVGPLDVWSSVRAALNGRRADFLISNPPYLVSTDPIEEEVRQYEPATALFAPESKPLHFYSEIALNAQQHLSSDGHVFVEIAAERASATFEIFAKAGFNTRILQDLAGRDRVLIASLARKG